MKIVFTVSDCAAAANVGGEVSRESAILEIPDDQLPQLVKDYLKAREAADERRKKHPSLSSSFWEDLAISFIRP